MRRCVHPSRYSMMLGLYPSQIGVRCNTQMISTDQELPVPTLAMRLRDAGFYTLGLGKTHWYCKNDQVAAQPTTRGFIERYGQYPEGFWNDEGQGMLLMGRDDGTAMGAWQKEAQRLRGAEGDEGRTGYTGGISAIEESQQRESWLARKAVAAIRQLDPQQRQFTYFSIDHPHAFFNPPQRFYDLYVDVEVPSSCIELAPPGIAQHFPNTKRTGEWAQQWADMPDDERTMVWRMYAACISFADHCLGEVITAWQEQGLLDDSVILFTSDHGDSMGERRRFSKYSLYDGSIRVPLLMRGPGIDPGLDDSAASLVDVLPTLMHHLGIERDPRLPGRVLTNQDLRGSMAEFHGHAFDQDRLQIAPSLLWRTKQWSLILSLPGCLHDYDMNPAEADCELYNLHNDPRQWNNLAEQPEFATVRARLTQEALVAWMMAQARFPQATSNAVLARDTGDDRPSQYWQTHTVE